MSSLSRSPENIRRLLTAAQAVFARSGFARASMADVAVAAGVARATLYLHFADKGALFEAMAAQLVDAALASAEAAWRPDASLADNLEATVLARDLPLYRLLRTTPHGAALLTVNADLTARHGRRLQDDFLALLARRARQAEHTDLSVFDGPDGFADFLATTCGGLKHEAADEVSYRAAVHRLCQVTARAAGEKPPIAPA